MKKFRVCFRNQTDEDAILVKAYRASSAAEIRCMDFVQGPNDSPEEFLNVRVRDELGNLTLWDVSVQWEPHLNAVEAKP